MSASLPVGPVVAPTEPAENAPLGVRLATLAAILLPVLGLVASAFFLWG